MGTAQNTPLCSLLFISFATGFSYLWPVVVELWPAAAKCLQKCHHPKEKENKSSIHFQKKPSQCSIVNLKRKSKPEELIRILQAASEKESRFLKKKFSLLNFMYLIHYGKTC